MFLGMLGKVREALAPRGDVWHTVGRASVCERSYSSQIAPLLLGAPWLQFAPPHSLLPPT